MEEFSEELYVEVIYELLHKVGCSDNEREVQLENVYSYLQDAFKFSLEKHEQLLSKAKTKEPPKLKLNIEIIEAKDLNVQDSSDPTNSFVIIYLESNPEDKYYSSIKSTLNPKWEEQFKFNIPRERCRESLIVEVWHSEENVLSLISFSSWKYENNLIGQEIIPLKSIPTSGLTMWYNLEKKTKKKSQGTIKIRLSYSSVKNNQVAVQEHRHLLRLLLSQELEVSKCAPYWWAGKFNHEGEKVLEQHSALNGLSETDIAFARWSVFSELHLQHPLSYNLFENLIERLMVTKSFLNGKRLNMFWDAAKRILKSCFSVIRNTRKSDKYSIKTLQEVLSIISQISTLKPPEGTNLFPEDSYDWLIHPNSCNIHEVLSKAIESGAAEWFNHILDTDELNSHNDLAKLQYVIKVTHQIQIDVIKFSKDYDRLFHEHMNCSYSKISLKSIQRELTKTAQPIVEKCCNYIRIIELPENRLEDFDLGTEMFKYYLKLKEFLNFTVSICHETYLEIKGYTKWFEAGVPHWLEIAASKALFCIEKAIELDQLIPVDDSVKYSSSAQDTVAVFNDIKIFWQQLDWPHTESASNFILKSLQDICNCWEFYAEKMVNKLRSSSDIERWCYAINNIEYIGRFIELLGVELNMKGIVSNTPNFALKMIENVAKNMAPQMKIFLIEGSSSNSIDTLMSYLEESLKISNSHLSQDNFESFLNAIWVELSPILLNFAEKCVRKQKPLKYFLILKETLNALIECFYSSYYNNRKPDIETLKQTENLLKVHSTETSQLIKQYYLQRHEEQKQATDSSYGVLTVQCYFIQNLLKIEILNAKHLKPMDSNNTCDPFVKIHLLPEENFPSYIDMKTKVQFETLFPLFDEKFTITLTPEQRALNDALIMFSVKDQDYFGIFNQYVGDCFIKFSEIVDKTVDPGSVMQMHMTLSRPKNIDLDLIRALEFRQGNKQAREFLKRLKSQLVK